MGDVRLGLTVELGRDKGGWIGKVYEMRCACVYALCSDKVVDWEICLETGVSLDIYA